MGGTIVVWEAERERRSGVEPGPRVRPRRDRWRVDEAAVRAARGRGEVPVLSVGGHGPVVLVTMDRGPGAMGDEARIGVAYADAVLAAGGRPLLVPPGETQVDDLLAAADAIVITGGAFDIHPRHYGAAVSARLDRVEEERTVLELRLARAALAHDLPVLGVCGGMQVLAVAAGGTLIQDLPAAWGHEQAGDPALASHEVRCEGRLATWLGAAVAVNSTHHQAVDRPGDGFVVAGQSPDGVIEAIVHEERRFSVGVQWHPELLGDGRLYARLVEAARRDGARSAGTS